MTFERFHEAIAEARRAGTTHAVVPVARRLSADLLTPVSAFLSLRADGTHPFLLESVEGGEKLARYSFLGRSPYRLLRAYGDRVEVAEGTDAPFEPAPFDDLFEALRHYTQRYTELRTPELPRLTGGAVGYLGYDAVRLLEHLPDAPPDDLALPDALWCFYDTVVAFDHVRHQLILMASAFVDPETDLREAYAGAVARLDALEASLRQPPSRPAPVRLSAQGTRSNVERATYEEAVRQAKRYIYEGDIFQVVLSQRMATPFVGDPFNLYRALRQVNPSPYLFFLDLDGFALAGSSPEVLVRVEEGTAEVLPIAGTRPRGRTPAADGALADELVADTKEQAEHLMLVDLGRNDLGRVCRYGSVTVDRYARVERYSHVMHLVSSVTGTLHPEADALAALAACFPAGTVSGAPKVRAMEIVDELEVTRRGVYAGAVGYVDFSGNLDTCIAIRTMVIQDGMAYVQAGAGIVADSDPAREFEETENKARALQEAMRVAAEELL